MGTYSLDLVRPRRKRAKDSAPYHFRGQWFDDLTVFWREFTQAGPLPKRSYDGPRAARHMASLPEHGTLAARVTLEPGERRSLRFVISWNFPKGDIHWAHRDKPDGPSPPIPTPSTPTRRPR